MHFIIDFHNKLSIIPRVIKKNFTMEKNSNKELFKELKETKHKLKIAGFTISIMFGIVIVPMFMNLKPSYLELVLPSLIGILGPIYLWMEKKQLDQRNHQSLGWRFRTSATTKRRDARETSKPQKSKQRMQHEFLYA